MMHSSFNLVGAFFFNINLFIGEERFPAEEKSETYTVDDRIKILLLRSMTRCKT